MLRVQFEIQYLLTLAVLKIAITIMKNTPESQDISGKLGQSVACWQQR